jgi:uncharacterized membrane protein
MLLTIVAAIAATWLGRQTWRRNGGGRRLVVLESLRWTIVALGVFTLWRPEWIRRQNLDERPTIAVLLDRSRSMETRDVVGETVSSRAEWLAAHTNSWQPLAARYRVDVTDFGSTNADAGTDLNAALQEAMTRHRNLRAVMLLSDGDWTVGESPVSAATRLRMAQVPVFAVAVGSEKYLPDLAVTRVGAPAYAIVGEQVFVPFTVQSHLPHDVRTKVTLTSANGVLASKDVVIPAQGEVQDAMFWQPAREGAWELAVRVPAEPDEIRSDNNEQTFPISIRQEVLKVLVVDSTPRWEYRYLRNALMRDPGVQVSCVLLHPDLAPASGLGYLPSLPDTKEALAPYDVVFLGDIGISSKELSLEDAERLRGLVEQQGSGLVFLPGRRGRQATFARSALDPLLPVTLDASQPEGVSSATPSALALTQSGRGHLLTMLAPSEDENAAVWRQLPGFYWHAAVEKARPGAEVLAVHADRRNEWGRLPLLVTRPAGNGKVLFMGTDGAWRWRRGVEDVYHYRFWGQVVRWMSYQRHLAQDKGLRVFFNPDRPRRGETVHIHATVLTPGESDAVTAEITAPGGHAERATLVGRAGGWGLFEGKFVAEVAGTYKIKVRDLQMELVVAGEDPEPVGRPSRPDVLLEVAQITEGASGNLDELDGFVRRLAALPERAPVEQRVRLWCHPLWGTVIITLLAIYWVGRKAAGLV